MCCWPKDGTFGNMFTYRYMTSAGSKVFYHGCHLFNMIPGINPYYEIVVVMNKDTGKLTVINGEFEKEFKITWLRAVQIKDEVRKSSSRRTSSRPR